MASRYPQIVLTRGSATTVKGLAETRGWTRHLDGWQPALLALLLAGSTAAIAIPRSVAPIDIPEPRLDPRALHHIAKEDAALAASADHTRLDVDVLKLGSALFAYGVADAARDTEALSYARRDVLDASARALRVGAPAVLTLRAHHLRTFLVEMQRYDATGEGELAHADYTYGYGEALRDHVVRPVMFMAYSGQMRWRTSAGEEMAARLVEAVTKDVTSQAWRTALNPAW